MDSILVRNEGTVDRVVRGGVGIALLALLVSVDAGWRWLGLVGLVPLLTGLAGTCPLYTLLGVSTCPAPPAEA